MDFLTLRTSVQRIPDLAALLRLHVGASVGDARVTYLGPGLRNERLDQVAEQVSRWPVAGQRAPGRRRREAFF